MEVRDIQPANYFVFDGTSCRDYGLRLLKFGGASGFDEKPVGAEFDILEDRSLRKKSPFHYGIDATTPLSFEMTFGSIRPLLRAEVSDIIAWLSGHQQYKWLEIQREDMADIRYKAIFTKIKAVEQNGEIYGFQAEVQCDCNMAYGFPQTFTTAVDGSVSTRIVNSSSYNGFIYPKTEVLLKAGSTSFSVINQSDNNREFCIELPTAIGTDATFKIDNERFIVECDAAQITNAYECLKDFREFRLVRGINNLRITGNGTFKNTCEFLYHVGY